MFKRNKLRARIVERGLTVEQVAQGMGINRSTLYRKLQTGQFTIGEVRRLTEILHLSVNDITEIFFNEGVA